MDDAPATTATQAAPAPARRRAENVTLWAVQALLALLFAFAGASKLVNVAPDVVDAFATIGLGQWFRYLTGTLELAGAIGLLIPRLSHLAALGLAGVMAGAVVTHLTVLPPAALAPIPAFLAIILALIAWRRRP